MGEWMGRWMMARMCGGWMEENSGGMSGWMDRWINRLVDDVY